jgi:hypothetical protein
MGVVDLPDHALRRASGRATRILERPPLFTRFKQTAAKFVMQKRIKMTTKRLLIPRSAALFAIASGLAVFCTSSRTANAFEILALEARADLVVVNNGANPVELQFRGHFEPMLKVELSFANRTCKLSDEQRKNLIKKSNAWLTEFIRDYAKQGGQPQMQGVWFGGGRPQLPDARNSIQAGVKKLVEAELPKEQSAIYIEESEKRSEFGKKVSVDNLVARIDKEVNLSPEQREKITKSLIEHWDKSWAPQLEMFMNGMDMVPNVPAQWIRPHLSAVQQAAWNRVNKQTGHMFLGGMGNEGQVIDDIDLHEDEEKPRADADQNPGAAVLIAPFAAPAN